MTCLCLCTGLLPLLPPLGREGRALLRSPSELERAQCGAAAAAGFLTFREQEVHTAEPGSAAVLTQSAPQ